MPTPLFTMTGQTATGDVVTGPGFSKIIIKGMPISCLSDMVSGPACTGTITSSTVTKIIAGGKPIANVGSVVTGTNPATGAPVSTSLINTTNTICLG